MPVNEEQLIINHIPFVHWLIARYYPTYVGDEDLAQIGMIGLCKAAKKWNPDKSKFMTFASKIILNEIRLEFRRRQKRVTTVSLDKVLSHDDDVTFEDLLVGEVDVDYMDLEAFLDELNPKERQCFESLMDGVSPEDCAEQLGCSEQMWNRMIRKIKLIWRNVYGNSDSD